MSKPDDQRLALEGIGSILSAYGSGSVPADDALAQIDNILGVAIGQMPLADARDELGTCNPEMP